MDQKHRITFFLTLSAPYLYENAIPSAKFIFGKTQMLGENMFTIYWYHGHINATMGPKELTKSIKIKVKYGMQRF